MQEQYFRFLSTSVILQEAPTPRKSINGGEMVVTESLVALFSANDSDDDEDGSET